tara:strand:- start:446 stop:871 length:426 start_codon:yes stop_codon:yes gene_type:complete
MNAVELEAYTIEQVVDANTNYILQSASAIETYYNRIIAEEEVINQVNTNIGTLSDVVDEAYNSVIDQNTSVSDSEFLVQEISKATDLAKGYHDTGIESENNIGILKAWILSEYGLIEDYTSIIDQKKQEMNDLYISYIIET